MKQKVKNLAKIYLWLFAGILICISAACMKYSDSFNFEQFLANGDVYEFSQEELTTSTDSCVYNSVANVYITYADWANKEFAKLPENKSWSYLYLNIANMNVGYTTWKIEYFNGANKKLGDQSIGVVNGENMIPITYADPFRRIQIVIENQPNLAFTLNQVQLRDSASTLNIPALLWQTITYFGIYLLVSLLFWFIWKGHPYGIVELLQYVFILFGDYVGSRIGGNLTMKAKNRLRTFLFWFLYIYMAVWNIIGFYQQKEFYKYGILVSVLTLVLIGLVSWEKPLHYLRWDGVIQIAWLVLWSMVCVSDLVVSKFYKFTGYAFLFGVGFFFFAWNNMERPKWIRNNMVRALEWTLPLCMVFCLLFRQKKAFVLYNGPFANREYLAAYAVIMLVAFLSELYYCLFHTKVVHRMKKMILFGIGATVSVYYLYVSYTLICIVTSIVVILLFAVMLLQKRKYFTLGMPKTVGMLLVAIIFSVAVILPFHMALKSLPGYLGTNLEYQDDKLETRLDVATVEAYQLSDPMVWREVTSTADLSAKQVWKEYLGRMNLFGHADMLYVDHQQTMAGDGWIEMAYRYGIFILIPYSLLLISCLYCAWKEKSYLMFAATVAFGIVMLTQNIELPFAQPLWLVFYLGMGGWFVSEEEKQENQL